MRVKRWAAVTVVEIVPSTEVVTLGASSTLVSQYSGLVDHEQRITVYSSPAVSPDPSTVITCPSSTPDVGEITTTSGTFQEIGRVEKAPELPFSASTQSPSSTQETAVPSVPVKDLRSWSWKKVAVASEVPSQWLAGVHGPPTTSSVAATAASHWATSTLSLRMFVTSTLIKAPSMASTTP